MELASPSLLLEDRPIALREFPVEACVVRDDYYRVVHEPVDGRLVDPVPGHHVVGDAGDHGYLGRDRYGTR